MAKQYKMLFNLLRCGRVYIKSSVAFIRTTVYSNGLLTDTVLGM